MATGNWIGHGSDQARLTSLLTQTVFQLGQVASNLKLLSGIMTQMNNNGQDYTGIESMFSVPAGKGQAVNDLIGSASGVLQNDAFIQGVLQRLG